MATFHQYNHMLMSNPDDAVSASEQATIASNEQSTPQLASLVCYTTSGPTFYYQASMYT